jgi:FkbM family methyltransferase
MREDYEAPAETRVVVDLGSNIGLSALYFLSRNPHVRCFLFEPVPRNVDRLRANLFPAEGRYDLTVAAVADRAGQVTFGVEETGRYGGIDVDTGKTIVVECLEINSVLERVLEHCDRVDVLKVDTEGAEEDTVRAIRPEILDRIDRIYFECHEPTPLHGDRFDYSYFNMTSRLVRRR